jgi:hypothetical protein
MLRRDGELIAGAEEERLIRIKHAPSPVPAGGGRRPAGPRPAGRGAPPPRHGMREERCS